MNAWLRSLNPLLPRSVQMLQLGGLFNATGNGLVLPFTFIYMHNVRDIGLGTAGLIVATNGVVSIVTGPIGGMLVDRVGGRRVLAAALLFLTAAFGSFPFVHHAWQGFAAMTLAGIGNGAFWPAQSTLIAGLTPPERRPAAFAMQRVVMNLGIGLGAVAGGLIATTDRPGSFTVLFAADAVTFSAYLAMLYAFVPQPPLARHEDDGAAGPARYAAVLRDRPFVGFIVLNTVLIFAGMSGFELLPVWAKNEAGVTESAIGLVFFVNTVVIVLTQLPIAKLAEGHRRMRTTALLAAIWAASWLAVPLAGAWTSGAAAAVLLAIAVSVFAIGECLHGTVQGPLVSDLAQPHLIGRYMALSALSWQLGFTLGPGVGGFVLAASPSAVWIGAGVICLLAAAGALALESSIPAHARLTPRSEARQASGVESRTMAMTVEDPLSPYAQPAPHPADEAAHSGDRRTPAA